tara:strand:+ start:318 stop:725 length:408 start_codon:yes stop_codon:yes gene_type:complete
MIKWNEEDLLKLEKKGLATNRKSIMKPEKLEKKTVEKLSTEKVLFALHREKKIPQYTSELIFHPTRKFRFDWAIPDLKVAIEFEGIMSNKSRHTTVTGYSKDCIKYNLAACLGWKVLRYTVLNYKDLEQDLMKLV